MKGKIVNYFYSIIITSYNEGDWLSNTVRGITSNAGLLDYEIIVVDDMSDDFSVKRIEEFFLNRVKIIKNKNQLGPIKSRNLGFKASKGNVLIFFDAHQIFMWNFLKEIDDTLKMNSQIDILGTTCYDLKRPSQKTSYSNLYTNEDYSWTTATFINGLHFKQLTEVPFVNCANYIVKTEIFEKFGGFDDGMILWGPEDREFSLRAWLTGYRCFIEPKVYIGHYYKTGHSFSKFLYDVRMKGAVYNSLRLGMTYFSEKRFNRMLEYLKDYPNFDEQFEKLTNDKDFIIRKHSITSSLKYDCEWFFDKFKDYLPFVYTDAYYQGIKFYNQKKFRKSEKSLIKSLKLRYSFGSNNKNSIRSKALLLLSLIQIKRKNYVYAIKLLLKAVLTRISIWKF